MRTCRFALGHRRLHGVIEGSRVRALTAEPWAGGLPEGPSIALSEVALLAPVLPGKIVGVARNFPAHASETGAEVPREPLFFFKPPTAVIGPGDAIRLPEVSSEVDYEAELAAVIGRPLSHASGAAAAREAIFGWTCLDDVTARDIQRAERHFTRAKSFDTFCPIGPVIETGIDPLDAVVTCRVNGHERQRGYARDMVFDPYALVAHISQVMTLLPGDIVSTGTPAGVGPLRRGDRVEVEVSGIGILENPVV